MRQTVYRNVAGLNQALRSLPKEASARLRDASVEIAREVAQEASSRALGIGGPAALVAPTIKPTRDRIPVVKMGGSKKLAGRTGVNQTIGNLIWGSEFGGGARPRTNQFMPHRGRDGYFLWPTIRDMGQDIQDEYSDALLEALENI